MCGTAHLSDMRKKDINPAVHALIRKFPPSYDPSSVRCILTPSAFAKQHLVYVQETGHLKLLEAKYHTKREGLASYLLVYVSSGSGVLEWEQDTCPLQAGDWFFINCELAHRYQSDPMHPWELWWVHFHGDAAKVYYSLFASQKHTVFQTKKNHLFISLQTLLTQNQQPEGFSTELKNSSLLTEMLTHIVLEGSLAKPAVPGKIQVVKEYLDAHFMQLMTIEGLAKHFFLSQSHLLHEFKKSFGLTIFQYILHLRITEAKHLLRFSDLPIGEIASRCGFGDPSYFNRQFQKAEGLTASQFRKQWRG